MVMQVWACLDKTIPGVQPSPHGSAGPVLVVITIIGQLCLAACCCNSATVSSTFHMGTSTSNPFLCAADFFLQLGSCKEAIR